MANQPRVNRGEAQAVLQAFGGGGLTIQRGQPPVKVGAPADAAGLATIRPISGEGFDGKHYCALDWHVVVLGLFYPSTTFTRDEATADAKVSPITLTLDGVVLDTAAVAGAAKSSAIGPSDTAGR